LTFCQVELNRDVKSTGITKIPDFLLQFPPERTHRQPSVRIGVI
jgi:hypothetical protein